MHAFVYKCQLALPQIAYGIILIIHNSVFKILFTFCCIIKPRYLHVKILFTKLKMPREWIIMLRPLIINSKLKKGFEDIPV